MYIFFSCSDCDLSKDLTFIVLQIELLATVLHLCYLILLKYYIKEDYNSYIGLNTEKIAYEVVSS